MSVAAETSAAMRLTTNWADFAEDGLDDLDAALVETTKKNLDRLVAAIMEERVRDGKKRWVRKGPLELLAFAAWEVTLAKKFVWEVTTDIATTFMPFMKVLAGGEETIRKNSIPFTIPVIDGTLGNFFRRWASRSGETEGLENQKVCVRWSERRVGYVCMSGKIGVYHEGHVDEKTGEPVPTLYSALDIWSMNKLKPQGVDLILESFGFAPANYRCFPMNDSVFVVYLKGKIKPKDAKVYLKATERVQVTEAAKEFWIDADEEFIATCERLGAAPKAGETRKGAGEKPRRSAGEGSNTRTTGEGSSHAKRGTK